MASPILWQSEDRSVTLIDIPRSIAAAQGTVQHPCLDLLLSCEPLKEPFPSNEPKSAAAKAKLGAYPTHLDLQDEYAKLCANVLRNIEDEWREREWCLPRPFIQAATKKRKYSDDGDEAASRSHTTTGSVLPPADARYDLTYELDRADGDYLSSDDVLEVVNGALVSSSTLISNPPDRIIDLLAMHRSSMDFSSYRGGIGNDFTRYRVPLGASFCLDDVHNASAFRAAVREQGEINETRKNFDFVLLDPPWPNRSVRRTHKTAGSTYAVQTNMRHMENMLSGMDLDMLMAEDCLVGIWITNKSAVRELMLGEGGLFETWGVRLIEEWVWLKTTVGGEPVTEVEAVWRKPYEVLLLGRKKAGGLQERADDEVKRRVVVGVPDLHSRKPCLKSLIEQLMFDGRQYRALEVFARYLVAGWWSWGDECIKFNAEDHWKAP